MKKTQRGFALIEALLILVIISLVVGTGYYVWHTKQQTDDLLDSAQKSTLTHVSATSSLPSGWSIYRSGQYKFQVAYPNSWGKPEFLKNDGSKGAQYSLHFHSAPIGQATGVVADLMLNSDDYVFSGCNDSRGCADVSADTENFVEGTLKGIKNGTSFSKVTTGAPNLVYHDNASFISIITNEGAGETDTLDGYRLISLPDIRVSAAYLAYELLDVSASCSQNKASSNSNENCITQDSVDTVSKVLKSIKTT